MNDNRDYIDEFDNDESDLLIMNANFEQNTWLNSYSDIVTLLLCFFIIFYAFEKRLEKGQMQDIVADIREEFKATGSIGGTEMRFPKSAGEPVRSAVFDLQSIGNVNVIQNSNFVTMLFKDENFFNFSSSYLNANGRRAMLKVIEKLKPIQHKIRINVRGHTDDIPVNKPNAKAWWKNNMELSAARALNVREFMLANGMDDDSTYITGLSYFQTYMVDVSDENLDKVKDINGENIRLDKISLERRISIVIEPR